MMEWSNSLPHPPHHGSVDNRPFVEGYSRRCSPPDLNPANWMATSLGMNSGVSICSNVIVLRARCDFIDVNISTLRQQIRDVRDTMT